MKISGFTFLRNGAKLYYPVKESILSALGLVDEMVIALGDCDPDDTSRAVIEGIGSPKIQIIDTVWDLEQYPNGTEHAHQTDIAKNLCTGDWLLYLQGDELIHEEDIPVLKEDCRRYLNEPVDGFVFDYLHFWGDYRHYQISHGWYKNEVRIIRNDPAIHSFASAQSFRRIPGFDGISYRQKKGTTKLRCKKTEARIFHYGWVRPPELMQLKKKYIDTNHHGQAFVRDKYRNASVEFDYGPMDFLPEYKGTHPFVMAEKISMHHWGAALRETLQKGDLHKHQRLKYRFLTFLEQKILKGRPMFESKNYKLV